MKRRVRLTESDLHRIVKEVLTELDWKTYANAANKRLSQTKERNTDIPWTDDVKRRADLHNRAEELGNYAKERFNQDYGYNDGSDWWGDEDARSVKMGGDFQSTEEFSPHAVGYRGKGYGNPYKYEHGWNLEKGGHITPDDFFDNEEAASAYKRADDEIKNYKKGNYDYEKNGRGWYKKN